MSRKIRLGPIAVFLAVVAVVLATLAVLTTATTNADKVLAERFAGVTQSRYALEAEGEKFLQQYDEQAKSGSSNDTIVTTNERRTVFFRPILFISIPVGTLKIRNQKNTSDGKILAVESFSARSSFT